MEDRMNESEFPVSEWLPAEPSAVEVHAEQPAAPALPAPEVPESPATLFDRLLAMDRDVLAVAYIALGAPLGIGAGMDITPEVAAARAQSVADGAAVWATIQPAVARLVGDLRRALGMPPADQNTPLVGYIEDTLRETLVALIIAGRMVGQQGGAK
jgi:hypothetical protein